MSEKKQGLEENKNEVTDQEESKDKKGGFSIITAFLILLMLAASAGIIIYVLMKMNEKPRSLSEMKVNLVSCGTQLDGFDIKFKEADVSGSNLVIRVSIDNKTGKTVVYEDGFRVFHEGSEVKLKDSSLLAKPATGITADCASELEYEFVAFEDYKTGKYRIEKDIVTEDEKGARGDKESLWIEIVIE